MTNSEFKKHITFYTLSEGKIIKCFLSRMFEEKNSFVVMTEKKMYYRRSPDEIFKTEKEAEKFYGCCNAN